MERRIAVGCRKLLFLAGAALCLTHWATPPLALALGAILAMTVHNPFGKAGHKLSKWLLQTSVVLLGFSMNLRVVLRAGANGVLFASGTIAVTLLLGYPPAQN